MSNRILDQGVWHVMTSCWCGTRHSVPESLYESAQKRAGKLTVFCPHGHEWVIKSQEQVSTEQQLRQERDRLKQQVAQKEDEIKYQRDRKEEEQRRVIALRGVVTKTKKRVSAGVCPCCNRTFQNLASHMATKHSDYQQREEVA